MSDRDETRIRTALLDDLEAMVGLLSELFRIEADFAFAPALQRQGLRLLLENPEQGCVLVAEGDGRAVGMVTVQVLTSTAAGGQVGLLEDLIVSEGWRGRGLGSALLRAAESWARARGLLRLQLLADRENRAGLGFYRGRRWQPTQLVCLRRENWLQDNSR